VAAQDLGPLPVYVVPQSRLPPALGGLSVVDGYTATRLDLPPACDERANESSRHAAEA